MRRRLRREQRMPTPAERKGCLADNVVVPVHEQPGRDAEERLMHPLGTDPGRGQEPRFPLQSP